jgi:hypothetical protein
MIAVMNGYMTVKGQTIPLVVLSEDDRDYLELCRQRWGDRSSRQFAEEFLHSAESPLPRGEPGTFIGVNLLANPLFQILFDMYWRLAIQEGGVRAEPDDDLRDPFRHAGPPSDVPAQRSRTP